MAFSLTTAVAFWRPLTPSYKLN